MRRNGEEVIGQALTSPFAIIFVFILMIIFVVVSTALAINNSSKDNVSKDFFESYSYFDGEIRRYVKNLIDSGGCHNKAYYGLTESARRNLIEEFVKKYPGYSFVLAERFGALGIGEGYIIHSKYGVFENIAVENGVSKVSLSDFDKVFGNEKSYDSFMVYRCDFRDIYLMVKKGLESNSGELI